MGVTSFDGPSFIFGNMAGLPASYGDATPDYNTDAGPSMTFMVDTLPDVRFAFPKDKVQGYVGVVPGHYNTPYVISVDAIPAALGAANIAAAQNVTNGTAMTLAGASLGVTPGINIRPNTGGTGFFVNAGALTSVVALDFGFAFGNVAAGNPSIPVGDGTQFIPGMPLVIGGAGAGGAALYTTVLAVNGNTITVANNPLTSNATAPIGTGNYWGPSPAGFPTPDAALPYVGVGPTLVFDTRQSIQRCVSVTGSTGATGGNFLITGYDIFNQIQTQLLTVPAGASTAYTKKTFKYILSIVPQFTDAHNYSVGTGDTFGFAMRDDLIELAEMFWNGSFNAPAAGTASGWLAADTTNPATNLTGDVRGTWQVSASGGGVAWAGTGNGASNGALSGLVMTGKRLMMAQMMRQWNLMNAFPATPASLFGVTPA